MAYYKALDELQDERGGERLRVALIYSWGANKEEPDGIIVDEELDATNLDQSSRDFLDAAIAEYNETFGTSFSTDGDKFDGYYQDVSRRMKERELDMLIVVGMFLTGFDATTLNTLWVDKNLKMHGLIQAFSRTNRILNSVKTFGNIVCFRNLEDEVDKALAMYGDKDAGGVVLLKPYAEYLADYLEEGRHLHEMFPAGDPAPLARRREARPRGYLRLDPAPAQRAHRMGRVRGRRHHERPRAAGLPERLHRDLAQERESSRPRRPTSSTTCASRWSSSSRSRSTSTTSWQLVQKYHDDNCQDKEIRADIDRAIARALRCATSATSSRTSSPA